MSRRTSWSLLSVAALALAALTGCDTSAEEVEGGVDQVQEGADQVQQEVEEGAGELQEGAEELQQEVEQGVEDAQDDEG
ncbi:hypothetical protein [uncultured Kocuria sp.]|uniref:hypothetical protein n=1 Tax=uncultured Kocuria sp. TaxID=259305 RepID=UPI0026115D99|nr:hypothetical protein [uncultured Kocuria sp.]